MMARMERDYVPLSMSSFLCYLAGMSFEILPKHLLEHSIHANTNVVEWSSTCYVYLKTVATAIMRRLAQGFEVHVAKVIT
jgi:hypothetical protein